jgi:hypothetical protein
VTAVEVAAQRGQFLLEARFHQPASNLLRVTVHAMPSIITLPGSARYRTRRRQTSNGVLSPRIAVTPVVETYSSDIGRHENPLLDLTTEHTESTEKTTDFKPFPFPSR